MTWDNIVLLLLLLFIMLQENAKNITPHFFENHIIKFTCSAGLPSCISDMNIPVPSSACFPSKIIIPRPWGLWNQNTKRYCYYLSEHFYFIFYDIHTTYGILYKCFKTLYYMFKLKTLASMVRCHTYMYYIILV